MQESLIAINITLGTTLLNKTPVPILYYWDGETQLERELGHNSDFIKYVYSLISSNLDDYTSVTASWFYYTMGENNEDYKDVTFPLQDIIYVSEFENADEIINHFLVKHFIKLYETSMKTEYMCDIEKTIPEIIGDIYTTLKEKFKVRVEKTTLFNWVRSVLIDEDKFNAQNTDMLIEALEKILKEYE